MPSRGFLYSNLRRGLFNREQSITNWMKSYAKALPLLENLVCKSHWIKVRYEDIACFPRDELSRICNFLGLKFEESMLNFSARIHHIANGNDLRFRRNSAIILDDSWKNNLSEVDPDTYGPAHYSLVLCL